MSFKQSSAVRNAKGLWLKDGDLFWFTCENTCRTEDYDYFRGVRTSIPAGTVLLAVGDHYTNHWWKGDEVQFSNDLRKGKVISPHGLHWALYNVVSIRMIIPS